MIRTTLTAALIALIATPALAQSYDPRIPKAEADADRMEAQALYDRQKQRDREEADRVAKTNLDRQSDYDMYVARQKADYEAKMAKWRADVARQQAEYEALVARCKAGDRTACAPR
ncbi:hypothetical protein [Sphingomonas sp.]|uniref:hypothetical protein n=1 Tax=Sphingomonas sp. TaxID=28214 RepID=UPI001ED4420B|nr:hypothetical protein [Sphingomonas sp.]MBX3593109.1 hypothetical protein [Sphingomonas sp.]